MYSLCVNMYCHRVTTHLHLTNISYTVFSNNFTDNKSHSAGNDIPHILWNIQGSVISHVLIIFPLKTLLIIKPSHCRPGEALRASGF
jgi:hypothetical protein